jgi:hypothetical protein
LSAGESIDVVIPCDFEPERGGMHRPAARPKTGHPPLLARSSLGLRDGESRPGDQREGAVEYPVSPPEEVRMTIAEFPMEGDPHATVFVEVEDPGGLVRAAGGSQKPHRVTRTFQAALATIEPIAQSIVDRMAALGPQGIEVELGFKLTTEGTALLVKGSGEANVKVKLTWTNPTR